MSIFSLEVINGFEMIQRTACAEISATRTGHRAFVGVYPPIPEKKTYQWRVRKFELPERLVGKYFGEEDLVDSEFIRLNSLEEVEELITRWGLAETTFEAPWKNEYPL